MSLFTKSIQDTAQENDGIRICIMRRPGENTDWDLWLPKLSPSNELLNAYKYEGMDWDTFQGEFNSEVLKTQVKLLDFIVETAKIRNITLLCWEETADTCHRQLVAKYCQALAPELEVIIR